MFFFAFMPFQLCFLDLKLCTCFSFLEVNSSNIPKMFGQLFAVLSTAVIKETNLLIPGKILLTNFARISPIFNPAK